MIKNNSLAISVFVMVCTMLSIVQIMAKPGMLLLERFFTGGGWLQILLISIYGAFIAHKMKNPTQTPIWKKRVWLLFSIFFFSQLLLGIFASPIFLMSGKLHFPIPALIIAAPIYRMQISFMLILFVSTLLIIGPGWCSQLCYFGAFDSLSAGNRTKLKINPKLKWFLKSFFLIFIVLEAILLRWLNASYSVVIISASSVGIMGVFIILFLSRKKKSMLHCTIFCPIGTIVHLTKKINPFRLKINNQCTLCQKCTTVCMYDALNIKNITQKEPGATCTLCGDCLSVCHAHSIEYHFIRFSPSKARWIWLFLTISLHAITLSLARI